MTRHVFMKCQTQHHKNNHSCKAQPKQIRSFIERVSLHLKVKFVVSWQRQRVSAPCVLTIGSVCICVREAGGDHYKHMMSDSVCNLCWPLWHYNLWAPPIEPCLSTFSSWAEEFWMISMGGGRGVCDSSSGSSSPPLCIPDLDSVPSSLRTLWKHTKNKSLSKSATSYNHMRVILLDLRPKQSFKTHQNPQHCLVPICSEIKNVASLWNTAVMVNVAHCGGAHTEALL